MAFIYPLYDRVVIKRDDEKTTAGGIVIPNTANNEKPTQGKVCFVGPGKTLKDGTIRPMTVKEGDTVLFSRYSGTEFKFDGEEYVVMKEEDVLAIIK